MLRLGRNAHMYTRISIYHDTEKIRIRERNAFTSCPLAHLLGMNSSICDIKFICIFSQLTDLWPKMSKNR